MKYAERYLITFNALDHLDMGSSYPTSFGVVPDQKKQGYETMSRYALHFLNYTLKKDVQGRAFLLQPATEKDLPATFLNIETTEALKAVPTRGEFLTLTLQRDGITKATEVYHKALQDNPDLILFEDWAFNRLGSEFFSAGRLDEALQVFILVVAAYPNSASAYHGLGVVYHRLGNRKQAIENIEKSLELNPRNPQATQLLKELRQE